MAYNKGKMNGGGKFMDNAKGMCSSKGNPMGKAKSVSPMCGPGTNADQSKANKLLQRAHAQWDSLRGKSGM